MGDDLEQLISWLLSVKASIAELKENESRLRQDINELMAVKGISQYVGETHTASIVWRSDTHSYPKDDVDKLVESWSASPSATVRAAAEILIDLRRSSKGYNYIAVKENKG